MPSKLQLDENLLFLYTCLQNSDYKIIDFVGVGEAIGLKPPAARMRFTRLRKAIESGVLTNTLSTEESKGSFTGGEGAPGGGLQLGADELHHEGGEGFQGSGAGAGAGAKQRKRKRPENNAAVLTADTNISGPNACAYTAAATSTLPAHGRKPKGRKNKRAGKRLEPTEDLDPIQTRSGSWIQRSPAGGAAEYSYKPHDRYGSDAESDTEVDADADFMQDSEDAVSRNRIAYGDVPEAEGEAGPGGKKRLVDGV